MICLGGSAFSMHGFKVVMYLVHQPKRNRGTSDRNNLPVIKVHAYGMTSRRFSSKSDADADACCICFYVNRFLLRIILDDFQGEYLQMINLIDCCSSKHIPIERSKFLYCTRRRLAQMSSYFHLRRNIMQ